MLSPTVQTDDPDALCNCRYRPTWRQSLGRAWDGVKAGWAERNYRFHLLASLIVILAGWCCHLTAGEWLVIVVFLGLIPALELLNTAVEEVCNIIRDELGLAFLETRLPRDLCAGAVLYASLAALGAGVIIFGPRIVALLTSWGG